MSHEQQLQFGEMNEENHPRSHNKVTITSDLEIITKLVKSWIPRVMRERIRTGIGHFNNRFTQRHNGNEYPLGTSEDALRHTHPLTVKEARLMECNLVPIIHG